MRKFWKDDGGEGVSEFTLIAAVVSVAFVAVMVIFRDSMGAVASYVAGLLGSAPETQYVG